MWKYVQKRCGWYIVKKVVDNVLGGFIVAYLYKIDKIDRLFFFSIYWNQSNENDIITVTKNTDTSYTLENGFGAEKNSATLIFLER